MLQQRWILYSACFLLVTLLMVLYYWQQSIGVYDSPYSNAVGNELSDEQLEHFSLEQQVGNKTRMNRYHIPITEGISWCGNISVWNEYAAFHNDVLQGHRKGRGYLRYYCRPSRCGGYGNRIQAITVALIMAMLSNRVFLLEMTYPLDIHGYVSPNAVMWDRPVVPSSVVDHDLYGPARIRKYWSQFAVDLLAVNGPEMIEFRSNEGFKFFYPEITKSPSILQPFMSLGADNRSEYARLYGCSVKYLFNLRPITTWAVTSQLASLGLVTGRYVAVHIRSSISSLDCGPRHASPRVWEQFLQCAVNASEHLAKKLSLHHVPIYLASDEDVVKEFAVNKFGSQVVLSQVYTLHVDRPRVKMPWLLHEGFLGMLTDMEVLSRAAVLVKSSSTFSDVIEGLGFFRRNESFIYHKCPY